MYMNFLVQIYFRAFHRTSYDKVPQPFLFFLSDEEGSGSAHVVFSYSFA